MVDDESSRWGALLQVPERESAGLQGSGAVVKRYAGRFVALSGALGLLLLAGSVLLLASDMRREAHREATREAASTAYLLADHAGRLFEVADVALRYAARATEERDWREIGGAEDLRRALRQLADALPYVEHVWLNDAAGDLRLTTFAFPAPASNAADRAVFRQTREGGVGVTVGERIVGRVTGRPTFLLARPLTDAGGAFRGMASVTAELAYFTDYWARIRLPFDARLTLMRAEALDVLAQHPPPPPGAAFVLPPTGLRQAIAASPVEGQIGFVSPQGDEPRRAAYHRVGDLPVYLTLSISEAAIARVWRARMLNYAPFAGVAALALLAITVLGLRQARRDTVAALALERAWIELARTNRELEARVAERTAEVRASEESLRRAADAARFATFDIDRVRASVTVSRLFHEMWGLAPDAPVTFDALLAQVHPADRAMVERHRLHAAQEGGSFEMEFRVARPDGSVRWLLSRGEAVPAAGEQLPARISGVNLDTTERKEADDRQALLAREVDHRAKNALAVVQAAMRLTPKEDAVAYARAVEGRVGALARAHSLLAGRRWAGADLRTLVEAELSPFLADTLEGGRPRADLDGPDVVLPPEVTQSLAMAIHELATNAVKHGALSTQDGTLSVSWQALRAEAGPRLKLRWTEAGGPAVAGPPKQRGFGTRILDATLRHQLGGKVALAWEADGLVCDLEIPLGRGAASTHAPAKGVADATH